MADGRVTEVSFSIAMVMYVVAMETNATCLCFHGDVGSHYGDLVALAQKIQAVFSGLPHHSRG